MNFFLIVNCKGVSLNSLENNLPFSVFIDEEGIENILCAYYHGVFIITMDG